ncbi:MAG: sensor histidine kinase [Chitinophagaceae bacterium]
MLNVFVHNNQKLTWHLYWKDLSHPFTTIGYSRTILVCYLSLWIFSWLFSKKQYLIAIISIVVLIFFDVVLRYAIEQLFVGPVFNLWQYYKDIPFGEYVTDNVFFSALGIFICFFLKIINDFFRNEMIKKEKINIELQFLKSQINPHFLFNTFNNLYGLSLTEPQKTPDAILKVSEMMRYMLYESNEEKVLLSKEITYLQNLIELQKMRYEDNTFVNFIVNGDVNGQAIAPLLLICFVENAFKHGEVLDSKSPLTIILNLHQNELYFHLRNKIHNRNKDKLGGIGMKNVRRRLDLLYPHKYKLDIKNDGVFFESELNINLS